MSSCVMAPNQAGGEINIYPEGKALCKKFEMTYLGEHTPKGSLFFRDMSSLPNALFINEHPDLVQMYKSEYNRVP